MKRTNTLLVLSLLLLWACKEDDNNVYPPVITELITVESDGLGAAALLHTDKGEVYKILNGNVVNGLTPDSAYRTYGVYELSTEDPGNVLLYSLRGVLSPNPVRANQIIGEVKTDPLKVQSVWRGGDYVNLALLVMAQDLKKHRFHFIDNRVVKYGDHKKLRLTLYHSQGGDTEAYFHKVYASVPLKNYKSELSEGDSILFDINTFEGVDTYRLAY